MHSLTFLGSPIPAGRPDNPLYTYNPNIQRQLTFDQTLISHTAKTLGRPAARASATVDSLATSKYGAGGAAGAVCGMC